MSIFIDYKQKWFVDMIPYFYMHQKVQIRLKPIYFDYIFRVELWTVNNASLP